MSQLIPKSNFEISNLTSIPNSEFRIPNSPPRRGVTLLFVISIIVLFLLMGTTFVVVSNDYLRAAKRRSSTGGRVNASAVTREEGHQLVVQSFLEAVRGPSLDNTENPLRGHDLLGDMYGYGIEATIAAATLHASEHFVEFTVGPALAPNAAAGSDQLALSTLANFRTSASVR